MLKTVLLVAALLPVSPTVAQNVVDPRCAGGVNCQIWGCNRQARDMGQKEFSNPPHCRSGRSGFADAEEECQRIGGRPRPGPGGAPFIWCDAVQQSTEPSQSEEIDSSPSMQTSGQRIQGILDLGIALLEVYRETIEESARKQHQDQMRKYDRGREEADKRASDSLGGFAKEFSDFANQSQDAVLGNIDQARQRCGRQVNTRLEIATCFRSLSATYVSAALECEKNAQAMSKPGTGRVTGHSGPARATGQRAYQEACSDIHVVGAKTANCVAVGILHPNSQFNSLIKRCAELHGVL